jgi:hypothetical protein
MVAVREAQGRRVTLRTRWGREHRGVLSLFPEGDSLGIASGVGEHVVGLAGVENLVVKRRLLGALEGFAVGVTAAGVYVLAWFTNAKPHSDNNIAAAYGFAILGSVGGGVGGLIGAVRGDRRVFRFEGH